MSSPPAELALQPADPYDGSGRLDPICDAILANRDNYGRVIWLFGDSIFRGAALHKFPDQFTRREIESEPLWPLRSPASMINLVLRDQGMLSEDRFGGVREAKHVACFTGVVGQPTGVPKAIRRLNLLHKSGAIRRGDALFFLNAGLHTKDPDLYEAQWLALRKVAAQTTGAPVFICDTFDNLSAKTGETMGEDAEPVEAFMYDVPWTSPAGRRLTHNEATRNAALASLDTVAETRLLQLAKPIADWHSEMSARSQVPAYSSDGIHLNVWGQMRLAGELLRAAWPDLPIRSLASTEALVQAHWQRLGYGGRTPRWTAKLAVACARRCYGL